MRFLTLGLLFTSACAFGGAPTEAAAPVSAGQAEAVFAGGCFWCIEADFEKLDGVISVESGYTGGTVEGPTYEAVSRKATDHVEAVRVVYDPGKVQYDKLVDYFFRHVDPTQADGQFCDRGPQYATGIFTSDPAEKAIAEKEKKEADKLLKGTVVTPIRDAGTFWVAEAYHQDYYKKNAAHYNRYRTGCGRDARVRALWGESTH